jgi:nucleotide-binding universal stress UspA family protein
MTDVRTSPEAAPRPSSLRTIVVGVDGSADARRALAWATERAAETGASIVAVHVLTYSTEFRRDLFLETVTTWRRQLGTQLAGDWTRSARDAGVTTRAELVEDDSAAAGLLKAASRANADLLVLGAKGHGNLAGLLGATTYKVSHAARVPVVIVPIDWQPLADQPGSRAVADQA